VADVSLSFRPYRNTPKQQSPWASRVKRAEHDLEQTVLAQLPIKEQSPVVAEFCSILKFQLILL
jgi:hypothetical protein